MVTCGLKETRGAEVPLRGTPVQSLELLLDYMYRAQLPLSWGTSASILQRYWILCPLTLMAQWLEQFSNIVFWSEWWCKLKIANKLKTTTAANNRCKTMPKELHSLNSFPGSFLPNSIIVIVCPLPFILLPPGLWGRRSARAGRTQSWGAAGFRWPQHFPGEGRAGAGAVLGAEAKWGHAEWKQGCGVTQTCPIGACRPWIPL